MGIQIPLIYQAHQNELVNEISKLGKPTVAVLLNGRAYAITDLVKKVPAIVEGWYLGRGRETAVAGVLFGDVNPSGHLPVTIAPETWDRNFRFTTTRLPQLGAAMCSATILRSFRFGFGLSYTTFAIGKPSVDREEISKDAKAHVSVTVSNTGSRTGDQVIQMYVHHPVSSVVQPVLALRGFKRVHLEAGGSTTVSFEVGPEDLSILDRNMQKILVPGEGESLIGANSVETQKAELNVTPVPSAIAPRQIDSALPECARMDLCGRGVALGGVDAQQELKVHGLPARGCNSLYLRHPLWIRDELSSCRSTEDRNPTDSQNRLANGLISKTCNDGEVSFQFSDKTE